jgi:iron complex transport system substrate-binding protein
METILRLEPDLVLAGGLGQEDVIAALQREGISVSRHSNGKISDTLATILAVGEVVGNRTEAEDLVAHLSGAIQRCATRAAKAAHGARPKVFYLTWEDPLLTAGSQTFIGEIIELAGGQNIFGDLAKDFPRVGAETVVRRRPQVVVMPSHHGGGDDAPRARAARAGFGNLLADVRYATVDGDVISRPGPRVAEAVAAMAAAIHGVAWADGESPPR